MNGECRGCCVEMGGAFKTPVAFVLVVIGEVRGR